KRVYLVVMLAGWEAEKLRAELCIPRCIHRYVKSLERHAASNGLSSNCLVASCRKLLAIAKGLSLSLAPIKSRANTGADLTLLFCPAHRLPFLHEVAERLDPLIGGRLLPPAIEQVHFAFRVDLDHEMDR